MKWKVDYSRGDGVVEIVVRDETGAKEFKRTANQLDKKAHGLIGKELKDKYGIDFTPTIAGDFFDY